jgi:hypothetical protein
MFGKRMKSPMVQCKNCQHLHWRPNLCRGLVKQVEVTDYRTCKYFQLVKKREFIKKKI